MKKSLIFVGMLALGYANAQEERVGINTETPSATLNIKTKTDATSPKNLELENQGGTKLVTVLNNGNVGIGTDAPLGKLHIEADGKTGNSVIHKGYGPWGNKQWAENIYGFFRARGNAETPLVVQNGDEIGHLGYYLYDGTAYKRGVFVSAKVSGLLANHKAPISLDFNFSKSDGSELITAVRMHHSGYVGINMGASTPLAPLHIASTRSLTDWTDKEKETAKKDVILIDVHQGAQVQNATTKERKKSISSSMYGFNAGYRGHSIDFGMSNLNAETNPFMAFAVGTRAGYPANEDTTVEHMRITSAGNIGIGTTSPTNKLHIKADTNPLKLEGLQAGTGEALVVDADGVVKKGSAVATTATNGVQNTASMECNATNRGKMNLVQDVSANGQTFDAFGICLKGSDGNFYWRYLYGAGGETTGTGNFGTGLQ